MEAFSWEIQPGLNFQQLYKPLEMDNYKEKVFFRLFAAAFVGEQVPLQ